MFDRACCFIISFEPRCTGISFYGVLCPLYLAVGLQFLYIILIYRLLILQLYILFIYYAEETLNLHSV